MNGTTTPVCLITGCALEDTTETSVVWGDLHFLGNCYIFNAVLDSRGDAAWQQAQLAPSQMRTISVQRAYVFERRGVLVFRISEATLNNQAKLYLANSPHAAGLATLGAFA